jgi:hypothetical protein
MRPRNPFLSVALLIGCALTLSAPAEALVLTPNLVNEDPSGLSAAFKADFPWLIVTITDVDADSVHIKIQSDLAAGPFISQVNWNSNVGTAFTFGPLTQTGSFIVDKGPSFSLNGFIGGGGATNGKNTGFDFEVQFSTANKTGLERFNLVDALDFDINCTANCGGFGASAFDAFNPQAANAFFQLDGTQISANQPCPGGPDLCYRVLAHIQGLTGGSLNSIWIAGVRPAGAVAEPAILLILGGALAGLSGFARSKFRR